MCWQLLFWPDFILALANQYLAFIEHARRVRIELAADYLVMAAWLAYLKSRMLIPEAATPEGMSAGDMANALAWRLKRLEAIRDTAARLFDRAQLGRDVFGRGEFPVTTDCEADDEPDKADQSGDRNHDQPTVPAQIDHDRRGRPIQVATRLKREAG